MGEVNLFQIAFEKLRSKYGIVRIVIAIVLALVLAIAFTISAISSSSKAASTRVAIATAEKLLDQGDYLAAKEIVEKVTSEPQAPETLVKVENLANIINTLETSQENFEKGATLQQAKQYLASIDEYLKVTVADRSNYPKALEEIKALQPLAIEQALAQAKALSRKKRIAEAISVIDEAIGVVGSDLRLKKAQAAYVKAQAAYVKAQAAYKKKLRTQAISKMRKRHDSFESVTWYRDWSSPTYANQNAFFIYFSASDGAANNLRLKVTYFDDDWLFVNTARINVDGEVYTLGCSNWERDNNHQIWEWCDEPLDNRQMIEAIIKSRKAVIRFDGDQYYDKRTITATQKRALRNVLKAYDVY